MGNTSRWTLLQGSQREREAGLQQIQKIYSDEPTPSHAMELGISLLWLQYYPEAFNHFRSRIEREKISGDMDFGMAGVAKWCQSRPNEAISQWIAGLKAKYARANGLNVRMPLLLFFAATKEPKLIDKAIIMQALKRAVVDPRVKVWPAPIAKLLLDQISLNEFEGYCRGRSETDTKMRHWLYEFYKAVINFEQERSHDFMKLMAALASTAGRINEDFFLTQIWNEEFFLARFEGDSK